MAASNSLRDASGLRVLYLSTVDTSLPNGPGVNEREFIAGLAALCGNELAVLVPRPQLPQPDLPGTRLILYRNAGRRRAIAYALQQVEQFFHAWRLTRSGSFDVVCARIGMLPIALYSLARLSRTPIAIKTL